MGIVWSDCLDESSAAEATAWSGVRSTRLHLRSNRHSDIMCYLAVYGQFTTIKSQMAAVGVTLSCGEFGGGEFVLANWPIS